MYRIVLFVSTCMGISSAAPQQSSIETVAEVKPTTFDLPFSIYDSPAASIEEPSVISEVGQYTGSDDYAYEITTENRDAELARYGDVTATENYDTVTGIPLEYDYGTDKKKFYSKLGYFLKPQLVADSLSDIYDPTRYVGVTNKDEEKLNAVEIQPTTTRLDNESHINDTVQFIDDKINNVAITSSSVQTTQSSVEIKPSIVEIKPSNVDIVKNSVEVEPYSVEIDKGSVEIKPNSIEFKPKRYGFKPNRANIGKKENSRRTVQKSLGRKFRSKCRCEKIWNCPKLQISVPRCPDEYFLCCF
ncbi:unnamed protein product, partial [Iphiclides podalirius]